MSFDADVPKEEDLETTDTAWRYMAYPVAILRSTARTARQMARYSAYVSDIGESVRPLVKPAYDTILTTIDFPKCSETCLRNFLGLHTW